jgi:hypothetical protein
MSLKLMVWIGLGLFALLSATDWLLTFALLRGQPDAFEANPLAAACLERYGWVGLGFYKLAGVVVVIASVILLLRRQPPVAAGVVALGCAVLLCVTVYTHQLICASRQEAREMAEDAAWPRPAPEVESGRPLLGNCWLLPPPTAPAPAPIATVMK